MNLSSNAIDPAKYLKATKTSPNVYYETPTGLFYDPFNFSHDDFGKLIIMNLEGHPEIKTVELILQDDDKGAYVVIYYYSGKVENYLSPDYAGDKKYVKLDSEWDIIENQDFEFAFEDRPKGIYFFLDIKIKNDQHIKISLQENRRELKRFSFLATVGAELKKVEKFPFIYLKDAGLVPIEGTGLSFELNGKMMELSKIPILVEGEKCYRIAYSFTRLPFFWDEEQDVFLSPEKLYNGLSFQKENALYSFFDNNGHKEIESIIYKANGHTASFRFSPAFPDIAALKQGSKISGKFCLGVDEIEGVVGGKYSVKNIEGNITIDIKPEKCWGSTGLKNWVAAYHYHADLEPVGKNKFEIRSEWTVK